MRAMIEIAIGVSLTMSGYCLRAYEDSQKPAPPVRIVVAQPTDYYNAGLRISASECKEICKVRDRMKEVREQVKKK